MKYLRLSRSSLELDDEVSNPHSLFTTPPTARNNEYKCTIYGKLRIMDLVNVSCLDMGSQQPNMGCHKPLCEGKPIHYMQK